MKIVISSGHAQAVRGASASPQPPYLDEVNEARKIVDQVAADLRAGGVTVTTFHDNVSTTQSENLNRIVNFHNGQGSHDLDVSVHLNASQKTSKPMGTEVLWVTQSELASKVSAALAGALQLPNRGGKKRTDLAFLNGTREKAILIEYCFVDSSADGDHHRAHFEAACQAIANTIGNLSGTTPEPEPIPGEARVDITIAVQGSAAVYVNGQLITGVPAPPAPEFPPNKTNVICTWFGGSSDPNNSAYAPYGPLGSGNYVALPANVPDAAMRERGVRVRNRANGKTAIGPVADKGPWLVDDDAYVFGSARSLAEQCYQQGKPLPRGPNAGKVPNGAGIDISPDMMAAIGASGKANVDWDFVAETAATS